MVVIKREPGTGSKAAGKPSKAGSKLPVKVGFARGAAHYKYQIALINSVVPPPWAVCLGSLGTGIVGVRPTPKATKVKKEKIEPTPAPPAEADDAAGDGEATIIKLPDDAVVVLLINSERLSVQGRDGRSIGGYNGNSLDAERAQLRWSTQHKDRSNKILNSIVAFQRRGGRVVVATRGGTLEDPQVFRKLGDVTSITDVQPSRLLVNDGETVVQERGSNTTHKHIKAICLDQGLRSGIGLVPVRYVERRFHGKLCLKCCYEPGSALLHFQDMQAEGVKAFVKQESQREMKREMKREPGAAVPELAPGEKPAKRLRKKLPLSEVPIKREQLTEDEAMSVASSEPAAAAGAKDMDEEPAEPAEAPVQAKEAPRKVVLVPVEKKPVAEEANDDDEPQIVPGSEKIRSVLDMLGAVVKRELHAEGSDPPEVLVEL